MPRAESIVAAIQRHGSDAIDLRDAAHEAFHAIDAGVPRGQWDRETINGYVMKLGRTKATCSELMARAVEQIVCERLGVPIEPLEGRVMIACMEAAKFRVPFMDYRNAKLGVELALMSAEATKAADAIIALGGRPSKTRRTERKQKRTT